MALEDHDRDGEQEAPAVAEGAAVADAAELPQVPAQRSGPEQEVDCEVFRTPLDQRRAPVHWFAGRLHEVIDGITDPGVAVAELDATTVAETVTELRAAMHRLRGLEAAVLIRGEVLDVAATRGATSTAAWLAHATTITHGDARRSVRLAAALDRHEPTRIELGAGRIDPEQAGVVVEAVDALPTWVSDADRVRAEEHLLSEARTHNARRLKILARHLLTVVDPEGADAELARKLDAEERRAASKTWLKITDRGDGTCHGEFSIAALQGAMFLKALHALASPARGAEAYERTRATDEVDDDGQPVVRAKVSAELLGEAFCDYIERFPLDAIPTAGGVSATVVVTLDLQTLTDGIKAAGLDTGQTITAAQARRLACQAGIIPAVLGGRSRVLDLGRRRRLHTPAQRIAMALRDGNGCTAEGCDRPAGWCHAHHDVPWTDGGPTDLDNGRLLCSRHHTLVHHPGYDTHAIAGNRIRIARKTHRRQ